MFLSEFQDGHHGDHLKNLFFASSPELEGQLTRNLVGSIRETCRSKKGKIFPLESQDGYHGGHLENLFLSSSPEPKGQLTLNLVGSIGVTFRSKIAKIDPMGNPKWPQWLIDLKLGRQHRGNL